MSASKSKRVVVSDSDSSSSDESTVVSVVSVKAKASKSDHAVALMERIAKLKSEFVTELAELEKEAKKALKGKLPKRASNRPKGETPDQVKHWNNFVKETHELMKTKGWPEFSTLSKGEDKPSVTFARSKKNEKGAYVFSNDGREPAHKDAMAYAGFRKRNGEYSNPEAEERARAKAEKKAEKKTKAEKSKKTKSKKAESESESESESEDEKPKKASKSKKPAKKPAESESESEDEKPKKVKKSKKSESESEKPKASKKPAKKSLPESESESESEHEKPALAAPAVSLVEAAAAAAAMALKPANGGAGKEESDDEEEELVAWTLNGKSYLRSSRNECWLKNADGSQGKWAGKYDPSKNKIDASAKEPELAFL